jgi:transcriptional regulator with XRE-family HTH domain
VDVPPFSRTRHHRETSAFRREVLAFGRLVRSLRRGRKWTIEEAAERFGVEPAYVRSIESGRTNPSLAVMVSVAEAFGMRTGDLLLAEPPGPAKATKGRR